jgi:hypothetical protein
MALSQRNFENLCNLLQEHLYGRRANMSVTVHRYTNKEEFMALHGLQSEEEYQSYVNWFEQETFGQHLYLEDEGVTYSSIYP